MNTLAVSCNMKNFYWRQLWAGMIPKREEHLEVINISKLTIPRHYNDQPGRLSGKAQTATNCDRRIKKISQNLAEFLVPIRRRK